ncbi:hypothetical protein MNV49_005694 [Pseudohyphozyma bogoriensis]|nr:hypothetical protein MNV49_005694 [Pseudohyphozyma bogoriensis]
MGDKHGDDKESAALLPLPELELELGVYETSSEATQSESDEDDALLPRHHSSSPSLSTTATASRTRWIVIVLASTLAVVLAASVLTFVAIRNRSASAAAPASAAQESTYELSIPSDTSKWYTNFTHTNTGVLPFSPSHYPALLSSTSRPLSHTPPVASFASQPTCLDLWVSQGEICEEMKGWFEGEGRQPKLDVVWTWVNGSESERLADWKSFVEESWVKRVVRRVKRAIKPDLSRHFRATAPSEERAEEWRADVLPSFNSLSIESMLPNIPSLGDTVLAMNDDFFTFRDLSHTDVASPILGPVYRMQRGFNVGPSAPGTSTADPEGEWKSLGMAAWLLDQRFGKRERPYLSHVARSLGTEVWREVKGVWEEEAVLTAETSLWSFFFGRVDTDQDGLYTPHDRASLLSYLTPLSSPPLSSPPTELHIPAPIRETLSSLLENTYDHVGLSRPNATEIEFSSMDGYAYFEAGKEYKRRVPWPSWRKTEEEGEGERPTVCTINVETCFGAGWLEGEGKSSVEEVFKRVAFEKPECGDCVIVALLGQAKKGLEAFLPPPDPNATAVDAVSSPSSPIAIGLTPSYLTSSFLLPPTPNPRSRCISLIQRYSYTIGNSPLAFYSMRSAGGFQVAANRMDREGKPAFLALNDDVKGNVKVLVERLDRAFKEWMGKQLPERSAWELE